MARLRDRITVYPVTATIYPSTGTGHGGVESFGDSYTAYCRMISKTRRSYTSDGVLAREIHEFLFQPGFNPGEILLDGWLSQSITVGSKIEVNGRRYRVESVREDLDDFTGQVVQVRISAYQDNAPLASATMQTYYDDRVDSERAAEHGVDHDIRPSPRRDIRGASRRATG